MLTRILSFGQDTQKLKQTRASSGILRLHPRDCVHIFALMKQLFSESDPQINMVNRINLQCAHSLLKTVVVAGRAGSLSRP